jgi:hypothetical protein
MKEALLLLSILPRDIITPRSPDMTPPANTERYKHYRRLARDYELECPRIVSADLDAWALG